MLDVSIKSKLGAFDLNVTFSAPEGVTAVFGRSGCGKTSVANALAGLLTPDQGHVSVRGRVLFDHAKRVNLPPNQRRIGYVFQDGRLFPHMTVERNLAYGGQHDAGRVVDMLGIDSLLGRYPSGLSGGEKQRVAIGRALMSDPQLLVMDEPLAALDASRKAEIMPYLERLRDDVRVPILYVSHSMSEVARLATTLVVLEAGKVVADGRVGEVLSRPEAVPILGVRDAGAVINAKVAGRLLDDGLTELAFSGGRIVLPGLLGALGHRVRIRIAAQDIILAREAPRDISALNVLPVVIAAVEFGRGPGVAVGLKAGEELLLARVTQRSAKRMDLKVGQQIHAIIKATAIAPEDVGG